MTTRVSLTPEPTGPLAPEVAPPVDPNRPEGLAPQFKDVAAQTASYLELQAELTRLKQAKGLPTGDPDPAAPKDGMEIPDPAKVEADKKAAEDAAAKDAADKSGVDLNAYQQEFNTHGDVAPESRDKLAKSLEKILGPDARTIVDQYIDGRKTSYVNEGAAIKDAAGGEEAYSTLVNWAAATLSPEEITVYNQQVNSGNRIQATYAVEALRGRFEKANGGREPKLLKGTFTPPSGAIEAFKSSAQMTEAMKDPRYKKDPAYREQVKRRIQASQF